MGESSSKGLLLNELLQLEVLVRMRQQMQIGEAAFQALEHCRDLVQITDHSFKIQVYGPTKTPLFDDLGRRSET
jgi:hypothetical protein